MLLDTQTLFSDDQALTVTAVSTNVFDLGAIGSPILSGNPLIADIGPGTPIEILIQNVVDAGGTSPTIQVDLEMDDNEGFASATVVASSATITDALQGDRLSLVYVPDGTTERYIRLNYTTGGTTPTHTVKAGIVFDRQTRPQ